MKVGTTSILLVNLDVDVSKISKIIWTLKSDNSTITKEYPDDVTYADGYFGIPLTQENTSALGAGIVKVEGQVNYTDKAVAKTVTAYTTISDTLATETVTGNRPNGETDITELHVKLVGEAIIAYTDGSGGGGTTSARWGQITGTLSSQTDLQNALNAKANTSQIPTVPTNVSSFTNDAGYLTSHQSLSGYATQSWVQNQGYTTSEIDDNQTTLGNTWSASKINSDYNKTNNFKTINNQSIIGSGNITIQGGSGVSDYDSLTSRPQINSVTLTGNKTFGDLGLDTYIQSSVGAGVWTVDNTMYVATIEDGDEVRYPHD